VDWAWTFGSTLGVVLLYKSTCAAALGSVFRYGPDWTWGCPTLAWVSLWLTKLTMLGLEWRLMAITGEMMDLVA
jgi:hypothetical protein